MDNAETALPHAHAAITPHPRPSNVAGPADAWAGQHMGQCSICTCTAGQPSGRSVRSSATCPPAGATAPQLPRGEPSAASRPEQHHACLQQHDPDSRMLWARHGEHVAMAAQMSHMADVMINSLGCELRALPLGKLACKDLGDRAMRLTSLQVWRRLPIRMSVPATSSSCP